MLHSDASLLLLIRCAGRMAEVNVLGGDLVNAFAGNPLIPGKRDHLDSEGLVKLLADSEAREGGGGKVLPFFQGRALVATEKSPDGKISWHLAWQPFKKVGLRSASEVQQMIKDTDPAALSPFRAEEFDKLVYLGEQDNIPYFALEVGDSAKDPAEEEATGPKEPPKEEQRRAGREQHPDAKLLRSLSSRFKSPANGSDTAFVDLRSIMLAADWADTAAYADLAIAGHARALLEWHKEVKFCGRCGSRSLPIEAGNRRKCSSETCGTKAYPRIDPVVIMMVIDRERDRAVLGRQARFIPRMWSCLAGFIEPGESLEEAVRRETREEVGLEIGEVVYHSSQPWPVGHGSQSCQLMVGFFAFAKTFDLTVDTKELQEARWWQREDVKAALTLEEYRETQMDSLSKLYDLTSGARNGKEEDGARKARAPAYVPGPYAIAHNLIRTWVERGAPALRSKV